MSFLGRLVVLLGADIGTFESDMGKAVRVAEQKSRQIERSAKGAGKAIGEIGRTLQYTNFGGLDQLTAGSRTATAAIKGLGASISLLGFASGPVLAITAAAGAIGYFATNSSDAEREAKSLLERMQDLGKSAVELATAPLFADIAKSAAGKLPLENELAQIRRDVDAANKIIRDQGGQENVGGFFDASRKRIAEIQAELKTWTDAERTTYAKITELRDEFQAREDKRKGGGKDDVIRMETMTVGPSPALQAELDNIKLARKLALEARTSYDLLFERMRDIELAAAALDVEGNPILDPAAVARLKQEALDKYYADVAREMQGVGDAADAAGGKIVDTGPKLSVFAEQAARNIENITASLLKGETQGRSFGLAIVAALRDIAAEVAAQQILMSIFGSWEGKEGWQGAFFSAIAGHRAGGGRVEAGEPYVVGEKRAELFVPDVAGTIVPSVPGAGGNGSVTVAIDARGATDPGAMFRGGEALRRMLNEESMDRRERQARGRYVRGGP